MTSVCLLVVAVVVYTDGDSNFWSMRMRNFQKFRMAEFDLVPHMSCASPAAPLCFVLFSFFGFVFFVVVEQIKGDLFTATLPLLLLFLLICRLLFCLFRTPCVSDTHLAN